MLAPSGSGKSITPYETILAAKALRNIAIIPPNSVVEKFTIPQLKENGVPTKGLDDVICPPFVVCAGSNSSFLGTALTFDYKLEAEYTNRTLEEYIATFRRDSYNAWTVRIPEEAAHRKGVVCATYDLAKIETNEMSPRADWKKTVNFTMPKGDAVISSFQDDSPLSLSLKPSYSEGDRYSGLIFRTFENPYNAGQDERVQKETRLVHPFGEGGALFAVVEDVRKFLDGVRDALSTLGGELEARIMETLKLQFRELA